MPTFASAESHRVHASPDIPDAVRVVRDLNELALSGSDCSSFTGLTDVAS